MRLLSRGLAAALPLTVACYGHSAAVHGLGPLLGGHAPLESRRYHFVRTEAEAITARASLHVARASGRARLEGCLEFGATGGRMATVLDSDGPSLHFKTEVELDADGAPRFGGPWRRSVKGAVRRGKLLVTVSGFGALAPFEVPWGPSSVVDAGHPLLWGGFLGDGANRYVRVVRSSPVSPRAIRIEHFRIEPRGHDARGRRILVVTRTQRFAFWLDEDGVPRTVRFRTRGEGERVEWTRSTSVAHGGCATSDSGSGSSCGTSSPRQRASFRGPRRSCR